MIGRVHTHIVISGCCNADIGIVVRIERNVAVHKLDLVGSFIQPNLKGFVIAYAERGIARVIFWLFTESRSPAYATEMHQ
jgi:hypothetical protein